MSKRKLVEVKKEGYEKAKEFRELSKKIFKAKYGIDGGVYQIQNLESKLKVEYGLFVPHYFELEAPAREHKTTGRLLELQHYTEPVEAKIPDSLLKLDTEEKFDDFLNFVKEKLYQIEKENTENEIPF